MDAIYPPIASRRHNWAKGFPHAHQSAFPVRGDGRIRNLPTGLRASVRTSPTVSPPDNLARPAKRGSSHDGVSTDKLQRNRWLLEEEQIYIKFMASSSSQRPGVRFVCSPFFLCPLVSVPGVIERLTLVLFESPYFLRSVDVIWSVERAAGGLLEYLPRGRCSTCS